MLELEENEKQLQELLQKLQELGESLWHISTRKRITRIRKANFGRKFLEWHNKFNKNTKWNKR